MVEEFSGAVILYALLAVVVTVGGLLVAAERRAQRLRRTTLAGIAAAWGLDSTATPEDFLGRHRDFEFCAGSFSGVSGYAGTASNAMRGHLRGVQMEIFDYRWRTLASRGYHRRTMLRIDHPGLTLPRFSLRGVGAVLPVTQAARGNRSLRRPGLCLTAPVLPRPTQL